ncbi:hypothetical protein KEM52_001288 [Ascosphaera acerosa]|nr:hypothetical protein KEM52_001288 [Ascosphaera acerosa]
MSDALDGHHQYEQPLAKGKPPIKRCKETLTIMSCAPLPTLASESPSQQSDGDDPTPKLTLVDPETGGSAQSASANPERRYWIHSRWRNLRRRRAGRGRRKGYDDELLDQDELCKGTAAGSRHDETVDTCRLSVQAELLNPACERLLGSLDPVMVAQETGAQVVDHGDGTAQIRTLGDASLMDVLYENQTGVWVLGRPYFSERPGHVPTWTTVTYQPAEPPSSAAVPDPSWEWAWPTWYIDMSSDVDENGWQYSLSFSERFCWHGNHPWFHSFVRRRKWLRLRVKRGEGQRVLRKQEREGSRHQAQLDRLLYEPVQSREILPDETGWLTGKPRDYEKLRQTVSDLPALLRYLKDTVVDREKLNAIDKYLDQDSEDQEGLPGRMHEVMQLFMHITSRETLLNNLARRADELPPESSDGRVRQKRSILVEARDVGSTLTVPRPF